MKTNKPMKKGDDKWDGPYTILKGNNDIIIDFYTTYPDKPGPPSWARKRNITSQDN
jgi:hypothetical protein